MKSHAKEGTAAVSVSESRRGIFSIAVLLSPVRFPGTTATYETIGSGHYCPCGCRKNNAGRSTVIPHRRNPKAGPCRSPDGLFRYTPHGTRTGHYHFCTSSNAGISECGIYAPGHPRTRRLFRRNRAHHAGAGLCHSGNQRNGRRAESHRNYLEPAGTLSCPGLSVCQ